MNTHKKGVAGRLISFVLVLVMLMSMVAIGIPVNAAELDSAGTSADLSAAETGQSGTKGDAELLNFIDSQTPYIRAEKSAYDIDTPVLVTADTFGKYPKAAIVLRTGTTLGSGNTIYYYELAGHEGQVVDLLTGVYNTSTVAGSAGNGGKQPYLNYDSTYMAVLYKDIDALFESGTSTLKATALENKDNIIASATINIDNANRVKKDSTTYLETSRKTYRYGDGIVVKAGVNDSSYPDAWVGVYQSGKDPAKFAPEYILPIGSNFSGQDGVTNTYNNSNRWIVNPKGDSYSIVNNGMALEAGNYVVKLFSSKDPTASNNVLCEVSFSVKYGTLVTDKDTYGYGEDVISAAETYKTSDVSISNNIEADPGLTSYSSAFGSASSTGVGSSIGYLYPGHVLEVLQTSGPNTYNCVYAQVVTRKNGLAVGTKGYFRTYLRATSDSDVKIYGTLSKTTNLYSTYGTGDLGTTTNQLGNNYVIKSFPQGTPYNYLKFINNNWMYVRIGGYVGYIHRNNSGGVSQIKQEYRRHNTDIPTYTTTDPRVALYKDGVAPGGVNNAWYRLHAFSQKSVTLQDLAGGEGTHNSDKCLEAGKYNIHLLPTSGYTSEVSKTITISDKVTGEFANGVYQVDDINSGFAKGRVAFELDTLNSYGYVGNDNTYAVVYWADANGKPLEVYSSFRKLPLDKNVVSFDIDAYTIIPHGAAGLVAYVESNGKQGEQGYFQALPDGCKTFTDLSSGNYTEFVALADLQLIDETYKDYNTTGNTCADNFNVALRDIVNISPQSAGIVIAGDITCTGYAEEYALFDSAVTNVQNQTGKTVPDIYATYGDSDDADGDFTHYLNFAHKYYDSELTADRLYYSKMISGYKFIFTAVTENGKSISAEQLEWIDSELRDNEVNNQGKPVFIICHDVPSNTVPSPYDRISNSADFAEVTKKYNNVFLITAHSFADLRSPGAVFGGDETLPVTISGSSTGWIRYYSSKGDGSFNDEEIQGQIVRIFDDKVVLMGRDFRSGKWIPEGTRVLINNDVTAEDTLLMQFGDVAYPDSYISNPEGRTLTAAFSEDTDIVTVHSDDGELAVADKKTGTTNVKVTALATDTRVITRTRTEVKVVEKIDYNYYLVGSFDSWGKGFVMTEDGDNVVTTAKLSAGTYDLKLKSFETYFGTNVTVNDATAQALTLTQGTKDDTANIHLVATGGTYVFTYNTSTKALTVTHTPFTEDELAGNELFNKAETTEPYLHMNKEVYKLGEPIYVTANGGCWVGLYPANETNYQNYTVYYYTEGSRPANNVKDVEAKNKVPFDITKLTYKADGDATDPTRSTGSYKVVLFRNNGYDPITEVYFDVVNGNENVYYNNIISTNKDVYYYGEDILVSGWTDRPDLKPWVAVVEHGVTPSNSTLKYWYYLPKTADGDIDATPVNLIKTSEQSTNVAIPAGKYDIYLYRTNNYNNPRGYVTIEVVDGNGTVYTDKDVYGYGEDISVIVTEKSSDRLNSTCGWVGIYDESVLNGKYPTGGSGMQAWYYVYAQDSYSTVIQNIDPQSNAGDGYPTATTGKAFHGKPGTYTAVLFKSAVGTNADYKEPLSKKTFTITDNVTGTVSDGVYQVDNLSDGFANGRVALELDDSAYGYATRGYVSVYWADAQGNPIEGFASLPIQHINDYISFDLQSYSIIPEGAAGLSAHISYNGSDGDGFFIPLPDGCLTYNNLDEGILSEFQMVSDVHINSEDVTEYSNGKPKLDNSQSKKYSHSNFTAMLEDIAQNSPQSSGIFINGDVANNGFAQEYAEFKNLYNASGVNTNIYVNMGNHDTYVGTDISAYINFANEFGAGITADAPYYSKVVNGYTYIFLAGDNSDYYGYKNSGTSPVSTNENLINGTDAELSDAQLEWLDAQLLANAEANPDKPVFVMAHQPIHETVYGTYNNTNGIVNYEELQAVLNKYNNVIYLSGHSHYELDTTGNIYGGNEDKPVAIDTSSVNYPWTMYYDAVEGSSVAGVAEGFYVRVYEDKVVLLGRDFTNNEWVPNACFVIYNKDVQAQDKLELIVEDTVNTSDWLTNSKGRELTIESSDTSVVTIDADGNIFAAGPGEATVTIFAKATDTEVITRETMLVEVGGEGYPSKFTLEGEYRSDDGLDTALIYTADKDIVQKTIELTPGEHEFHIAKGEEIFGKNVTINDKTEGAVLLGTADNFTLNATGGYYTFTYSISRNELEISYKELDTSYDKGEKEATIYVDYKNSAFGEKPYIYIWDETKETVNKNIGELAPGKKLLGPNAEGYYYITFKYDGQYQFVISDGADTKTADSQIYDQSEVYVIFKDGGLEYDTEKPKRFWVDATPNDPSDPIDRIYAEYVGVSGGMNQYIFYLPSGLNTRQLRIYADEGLSFKIAAFSIDHQGLKVTNLSGAVNKTNKYKMTGGLTGQLSLKQSAELPAIYLYTNEIMPLEPGYADSASAYNSTGSIKMFGADSAVTLDKVAISKVTGSDYYWDEANEILGKYGYEVTLNESTALIPGGEAGKDYILIALSADEARMRGVAMNELAEAIGLDSAADVQPVDFYNNGNYMGSYLLVEKKTPADSVKLEFKAGENSFTSNMGQVLSTNADVTAETLLELEALWNAAEAVIYNEEATYAQLSAVIDVESFAKVYLLQELAKGATAGADSYYVYYRDGKLYAGTDVDFEQTLGQYSAEVTLSTDSKFTEEANGSLTNAEGWYANSKVIEGTNTLNAQSALCQNENFWNAVKGEWVEVFYDNASALVPTRVTAIGSLTGGLKEYYDMMLKSTNMDEAKWAEIASDSLSGKGNADTGDTYANAVIYLNNYIYDRLDWMDERLSGDYTLPEPTLTTDRPEYAVNQEVTLRAEIGASGTLTYEFYNGAGELVYSETNDKGYAEYKFTPEEEIEGETYKVVITSKKAEAPVEAQAVVIAKVFDLELKVEAPDKVATGSVITINASAREDVDVEYILTDADGNFVNKNTDGVFYIITERDEEERIAEYTVTAKATVDGMEYTASEKVSIEIFRFEFAVTLTAPESVEEGSDIRLDADAGVEAEVTYTFYDAKTNTMIAQNSVGTCLIPATHADIGSIKEYYVVAECEVYGGYYEATSEIAYVEITEVKNAYKVTIYFKSTSTYGYRPLITTSGAVSDLEDMAMEKDTFITKNETETASYYWYKADFSVSMNSPSVLLRILSARYAMEVQTTLLVTEAKTYYFAVDNLNSGTEIVDLTNATEDERNWCKSAVHMVYDPKADGEEALAEVSARVDLRLVGDTNADGTVNIKDATYIQKGLADIITMSGTDMAVADVDDDLKVSVKDATFIQKKLAGLIKNSYTIYNR